MGENAKNPEQGIIPFWSRQEAELRGKSIWTLIHLVIIHTDSVQHAPLPPNNSIHPVALCVCVLLCPLSHQLSYNTHHHCLILR